MRRVAFSAFLTLCLLCSSAIAAFAQASSGITGTVTDTSGSVVVGAQVTIKSVATDQETLNDHNAGKQPPAR